MSELGEQVLKSARSRLDLPFRHHYEPLDVCQGGRETWNDCMERGMDPRGFDCSGLAIASLCDVLAISTSEWPQELRHTKQLTELASEGVAEPGDLRLYYFSNDRIHLGITTPGDEVIHASGVTEKVEETIVTTFSGVYPLAKTIAVEGLARRIGRL